METENNPKRTKRFIKTIDVLNDMLKNDFYIDIPKISTGFNNLDNILGGGIERDGGLYVLGAANNMGKSTFVAQIANFIATQTPVLFYSFETNRKMLLKRNLLRFIYQNNKKDAERISKIFYKGLKLEADEKELINSYINKYKEIAENMFIFNTIVQPDIIEQDIENFKNMNNAKPIIIIDLLQNMVNSANTKADIDSLMTAFRSIATVNKISIIIVSSVSRAGSKPIKDKDGNICAVDLTNEHLKESGNIETNADIVLLMQYENLKKPYEQGSQNEQKIRIKLTKNRYGRKNEKGVCFTFNTDYGYFTENNNIVNNNQYINDLEDL